MTYILLTCMIINLLRVSAVSTLNVVLDFAKTAVFFSAVSNTDDFYLTLSSSIPTLHIKSLLLPASVTVSFSNANSVPQFGMFIAFIQDHRQVSIVSIVSSVWLICLARVWILGTWIRLGWLVCIFLVILMAVHQLHIYIYIYIYFLTILGICSL